MGLKSGSRDAGLDGSEAESESNDEQEPTRDRTETQRTKRDRSSRDVDTRRSTDDDETDDGDTNGGGTSQSAGDRPTMQSIPYKLRREKVNEGREQVPYFLREEIIEAEDELQAALEAMLGEDVYKSDYREAAMVVAQRNPELVAEVLREWGYDLNTG